MPNAPKTLSKFRRQAKGTPGVRPSSTKRGYDRQWRNFREDYLAIHPLCEDCAKLEQRTTIAVELHHVKKVVTHPHLRLDPENVIGLCKRHHSMRTARGE